MNGIRASIVVPAYNAEHMLGDTLRALQAQSGAPAYEVLVVDNASTDSTAAVARGLGVTVLHESKRGPAAARNCGIRAARGELILCCDADTVPSRRWVAEMTAAFNDAATVLAAGNTLCYPPQTAAERFVARSGLYDMEEKIRRPLLPFVMSLNLAVRRDAAVAVGGFCEELITAEDVDFSQRIVRAFGTAAVYVERAVLYHRVRSDARALARQAFSYGEGMAECYRRYPDEVQWSVGQTAHVVRRYAARGIETALCAMQTLVGKAPAGSLEFLRYRALWDRCFWGGFFTRYYAR